MTDIVISCDTLVRASNLLSFDDCDAIRFENGIVIATTGKLMSVEYVGGWLGAVNIVPHTDLIAQCVNEAKFGSKVTITYNEMLGFATAKTMFGYVHPTNLVAVGEKAVTRWRSVTSKVHESLTDSVGAMYWEAETIASLARVAPSKAIMFEEFIDVNRPVLVKDTTDPNWIGLFAGFHTSEDYTPAVFPAWAK